MSQLDPELLKYATTERQREIFKAVVLKSSHRKAAEFLKTDHGNIDRVMSLIKKQAALKGYSPQHDMTRTAPDPFVVKGVSGYYDKEGQLRGQWVKTSLDAANRQKMIETAYESMSRDVKRAKPLPAPKSYAKDLCNVITITDAHIGMYARKDWDLETARRVIVGSFQHLMSAAPAADTCVVAQLGDFLHYDGLIPVTPTSRHVLDAAGSAEEMIDVAIETMRAVIDLALQKHRKVVVLIAEGNHDMGSAPWLRRLIKTAYEKEPRVEIIWSDVPYYAYKFGETMLFWHHSHMKRLGVELALAAATMFSKIWGTTTKRYGHTGDKHHRDVKEFSGMIIEQHPTMAGADAYTLRHGWSALRSAQSITYHIQHGEVGRNVFSPSMLLAA